MKSYRARGNSLLATVIQQRQESLMTDGRSGYTFILLVYFQAVWSLRKLTDYEHVSYYETENVPTAIFAAVD